MSRSGYSDDSDHLGLYRGTVGRSIAGKRGQLFLRELEVALLAMPEKQLEARVFVDEAGVCAMGAVAVARGVSMADGFDPDDPGDAGELLGISYQMAAEIAFENDDHDDWGGPPKTPGERWAYMLDWTRSNIHDDAPPSPRGRCAWCCRKFKLVMRHGWDGDFNWTVTSTKVGHHLWRGEKCQGAGGLPMVTS